MLVVEPEPGESAERGLAPGLAFTDKCSEDNGEHALEPSELDDLDRLPLADDIADRAATLASSCINNRLCSGPSENGSPFAAAAAAAAKSLPRVTSALP